MVICKKFLMIYQPMHLHTRELGYNSTHIYKAPYHSKLYTIILYIQYVQIYLNWFLVVYMLTKINMRLWRIVCYLRYVSIIISTLCKLTGSLFSKHILDDLSLIFRLLPITINSILHTFNSELLYLHIVFIDSAEIVMSSLIKILKLMDIKSD